MELSETPSKDGSSNIINIFENTLECIALIDRQGNYLSVNADYAEVYGYQPEAMIGMSWKDTIHKSDIGSAEKASEEMLAMGRSEINLRGIRKNGTAFYKHIVLVKGLENFKSPVSHYCFIQDITDQTLEERKLIKEVVFNYQKFKKLVDLQPECVKQISKEGELLYMNAAGLAMIEADSLHQVKGLCLYNLITDEHRKKFIQLNQRVFAGETTVLEFEIEGLKGTRRWLETHACPVKDSDGLVIEHLAVARDITKQKDTNEALAASEARFRALYNDTPAMFFNADKDGVILSVNAYGANQLGYKVDELKDENVSRIIHKDDRKNASEKLRECFEQPDIVHRWNLRKVHKDGHIIMVKEAARVVNDAQGESTLFIVCEDISEAFRLSEELSYQATHDALTGLVNRSEFERRLQRVIEANQSDSGEHAICYLDLDQFKIINDTCGHLAGDELLRQLSELLLSKVRKRDTLARLGGDEFGVLMEHCDIAHARRVTDSLRSIIEEFRFVWQDKKFSIGVSIGLVPISVEIGNVNEVLSAADAACYAAKDAGRNRVHIYSVDDKQVSRHRGEMKWVARINQALEEDLFILYYQNIVSVEQGLEHGEHYELLIRMKGKGEEVIPPGAFLPAAERFGLATKIDRWVVNTAFSWLATHPLKQKKLELCTINLSGQTLGNDEFMEYLFCKLDENLVAPGKICFEITETSAVANLSNAIRFIKSLRGKGCRFALDDFGSGVSSFGYLKNLPVDFLKIDGAFVRDIVTDRIDRAMVKSINEIGQIMGKKTIAEFVENDSIMLELKKQGVDFAQGYGISKPRPLRY